jgi:hypothetical protein
MQVECEQCKLDYINKRSQLIALKQDTPETKTIKNRKTGEVIESKEVTKRKKTGKYICRSCAGI